MNSIISCCISLRRKIMNRAKWTLKFCSHDEPGWEVVGTSYDIQVRTHLTIGFFYLNFDFGAFKESIYDRNFSRSCAAKECALSVMDSLDVRPRLAPSLREKKDQIWTTFHWASSLFKKGFSGAFKKNEQHESHASSNLLCQSDTRNAFHIVVRSQNRIEKKNKVKLSSYGSNTSCF